MKKILTDFRKGIAKIQIENLDDLWYLSHIVDSGDFVKGKTTRKIKLQTGGDKTKVIKKTITIEVEVEKIEFSKTSNTLRISGKISNELEDIPKGSYHTISVEQSSIITIKKDSWLKFQIDRLKESFTTKLAKILICVFDREDAVFALMKKYGFEVILKLQGEVEKKREGIKGKGNFYSEIIKKLDEYDKRHNLDHIILASPSFWKEELLKVLKNDKLKKKLILSHCSTASERAINEVLKRDETKSALAQDRIHKEMKFVDKLLSEISKDGKSVYALKQTKATAEAGAVQTLLVTDKLILKKRNNDSYVELDYIMRLVDNNKGDVIIVSSEHDGGKKLEGLGGIAGILRYKLDY